MIPQVFDEKWVNECNLTILGKFIVDICCYSRFQTMNIETGVTVNTRGGLAISRTDDAESNQATRSAR